MSLAVVNATSRPLQKRAVVVVFGATGYVGQAVCLAFARAASPPCSVLGVTRPGKPARALQSLSEAQVHIVEADLTDAACERIVVDAVRALVGAAEGGSCRLDAVVDASGQFEGEMEVVKSRALEVAEKVSRMLRASGGEERVGKPAFVYTSGHWLHGDARGGHISEEDNVATMAYPMVRWEVDHERRVLGSAELVGVVLRPPYVYGIAAGTSRCNSRTWMWFAQARERAESGGRMVIVGEENTLWPMVHVVDLAEAYVKTVVWVLADGRGSEMEDRVFLVANQKAEALGECMTAVRRVVGLEGGVDWSKPGDKGAEGAWREFEGLEECLVGSCRVVVDKAERVLGWKQAHAGFCDGVDEYFREWEGSLA